MPKVHKDPVFKSAFSKLTGKTIRMQYEYVEIFLLKDVDYIAQLSLVGDAETQQKVKIELENKRAEQRKIRQEKTSRDSDTREIFRVTISCQGQKKAVTIPTRTMQELEQTVRKKFKKRGKKLVILWGVTELNDSILQTVPSGTKLCVK
eukprot:TRINITY_DN5397_c0_g1_i1.p1 TRINITY_DN5397_c0_g1~~TRINITY_DN5397_c0_g1_i1.p1  ORF type:complete len:149 (-),score=10.28 TRINITY_DN5397_c0_g1_i1:44-490(-)